MTSLPARRSLKGKHLLEWRDQTSTLSGSLPGLRDMTIDAESVAASALRSPSVSRLFPGGAVEVATYLPGKRITGVRVRDSEIEVHVVAKWGRSLADVGEEVRSLVEPVAGGLPVSIFIDDVDPPAGVREEGPGGSAKSP